MAQFEFHSLFAKYCLSSFGLSWQTAVPIQIFDLPVKQYNEKDLILIGAG